MIMCDTFSIWSLPTKKKAGSVMMKHEGLLDETSSIPGCTCCNETVRPMIKHHGIWLLGVVLMGAALFTHWLWPAQSWLRISLYAAVVWLNGRHLLLQGLQNLVKFRFDMKTLMTLAVIGGMALGEWLEVAVIILLFALGERLERYAVDRAENAIGKLLEQAPQSALVQTEAGWQSLPVAVVRTGMRIRVRSGTAVPLDGVVVAGESALVEAMITGEPMPVDKQVGDVVYAGTLNQEGTLDVEVTAEQGDTRLAKIVELVMRAQSMKSRSETVITRFARYYTPIVMVLALAVILVPTLVFGQPFALWFYQGLAVLLIGCPCALVIATPTAVVAAHAKAAQAGVLIKGGRHLETLGRLEAIAFDKTGTLTVGKPAVMAYTLLDHTMDEPTMLARVAALESRTDHPIAKSLLDYVDAKGIDYASLVVTAFMTRRGAGVQGRIDGVDVVLRKPTEQEEAQNGVTDSEAVGTVVMVLYDDIPVARFLLADTLRKDAIETMRQLEKLGVRTRIVLSGDSEAAVHDVAGKLALKAQARLMPEAKLVAIEQLKEDHRHVGMVGDGVNDAPALALADLGIAMGAGASDIALETADVALLGDDLRKLPFAMRLSRRTHRIIWTNIVFALGLKLVTLSLVIPGRLTLWFAILADVGATLVVVLNSLRLLQNKGSSERRG
ncbi:MAG: cadmium-translocating P-type ATPase [Acholeplasmatales bacterium]|nr:MAG: cadmium-translocating P-type ATPase [Acholeplasmatales bacterium]